jgi:GTPase Era involved in 16S rRNA processing
VRRSRKPPNRFYYIGIRVTRVEKLRTQAAAAEADVTMSEYVREAVLRKVEEDLSHATAGATS